MENPAFQPNAGATGSASDPGTTTDDPTTDDPTTDDPTTTTTTTEGPTTDVPTTDDPTTEDPTETDSDTSTDTDESESDTDPVVLDCWDSDVTQWEVTQILDAELGINPADPWISPDGLELFYVAGQGGDQTPPQERRAYHSTRASRDELFTVGDMIAEWPNTNFRAAYPVSNVPGELLVSLDYDLYASVFNTNFNNWTEPALLESLSTPWFNPNDPPWTPENQATQESISRLTEDGGLVMFLRQDGLENPTLGAPAGQFYEALRDPNPDPGTPFSTPEPTVLPDALLYPYPHIMVCPALSPDGRTVIFSSTYPDLVPMDEVDQRDALRPLVMTRPDITEPWDDEITAIDMLREEHWQICPTAITRDGCELVYIRWLMAGSLPQETDRTRIFIATREPT